MPLFGFILQQAPAGNPLLQALPLVLIAGIFYFLVFMPMQRQKKQQAQMLSNLQSGSEVVTTGGIMGTIVSLSADSLVLRVKPDNIKLQVSRGSITSVIGADGKTVTVAAGEEKK